VNPTRPLAHRLGALFMVGFEGLAPSAEVTRFIRQNGIGGVILFSRNIEGPAQCADLTARLRALLPDAPLLMGIDQEGGRVARLSSPFTVFPPAREFGQRDQTEWTYRCAQACARELAAVGINLNFAPVLDVDTNPANPVIGDRAFGATPAQVIRHALQVISGLQDSGVAACGKHFPGHGDTATDSHKALPYVDHAPARLDAIELPPFIAAAQAGVAAIMTAHVLYRQWDDQWPASLSEKIVAGLLRGRLGFDGVVMTDDLEMRGVTDGFSVAEAAVRALEVGSDMVLVCHSLDRQQAALAAVTRAVSDGRLSESRVAEAAARVQRLKTRFPPSPASPTDLLAIIGCPDHPASTRPISC